MKIIKNKYVRKFVEVFHKKYCKDYYYYVNTSAYDIIKTLINDEQLIAVLCGQFGNYGTGAFNVVLDMDEMSKLSEASIEDKYDVENVLASHQELGKCSEDNLIIKNNITNISCNETAQDFDDDYDMGF